MMKKVLTILIATVLLASGMHVTIDHHYCCGTLADTKISITGKMASCGMEQSESSSPFNQVLKKKCCEDRVSYFSITGNYYPEYFRLENPASERGVTPAYKGNWISDVSYNPELINCVFPPGDTFNSRLTQSGICVFRI